jgi:hypothetical protein
MAGYGQPASAVAASQGQVAGASNDYGQSAGSSSMSGQNMGYNAAGGMYKPCPNKSSALKTISTESFRLQYQYFNLCEKI